MEGKILEIQDVLGNLSNGGASPGISIRGIRFDCECTVVLRHCGNDTIEVVSVRLGPVSVIVGYEYFLLDQNQLKTGRRSLYNTLVAKLSDEAIRQSHNIPDSKWTYDLKTA
jgi:hypothetical protein